MLKPIYSERLSQCKERNGSRLVSIVKRLSEKVENLSKPTNGDLITIYGLSGEPLFKAYSIKPEENDD